MSPLSRVSLQPDPITTVIADTCLPSLSTTSETSQSEEATIEALTHLGDFEMRVHHDLDRLDSLEEAWRRLTVSTDSPFQTYLWNAAWYYTYASNTIQPLLFELRREGETVAILPCYREGKTIRLAGDRLGGFQDAVALRTPDVALLLHQIRTWLDQDGRGCHFRFEKLSSIGSLFPILHDAERMPSRSLKFAQSSTPSLFTEIHGGLEAYLATLPAEMERDLRDTLQRFDHEFPQAEVTTLKDFAIGVDDLWTAAAFHVEHCSKSRLSPFRDHRLIDFFARITKDPEVGLQLSFLETDEDILAIDFGFVRGACYYGYLNAYDSAHTYLRPNQCHLLKRLDRWVKDDQVETLDFLDREEENSLNATDSTSQLWSMRLMPDGLRNRVLHVGLESNRYLREFARNALGKDEGLPS